jgi:glycosyltransferase involved in cell wall biosynthesis
LKVRHAGVPAERVVVIRNAIDTRRFDAVESWDRERLRQLLPTKPELMVTAAGRLSPEKGFGLLVEAAASVIKELPETGFILFGDGPLMPDLRKQVQRHGLQDRFILAGFRSDVDQLMPHSDLVVLPSYTEGLPNVALEALAAGVPVVATAVGGTPEVVEDGVCGLLAPPGDAPALAQAMVRMLQSKELRQTMGRAGRQRIAAHFTFAAQGRLYERLFEELVGTRHSRKGG